MSRSPDCLYARSRRLLRTGFGIAPVNKLVSLTWLLWALRSFRSFTLHYISHPSDNTTSQNIGGTNAWAVPPPQNFGGTVPPVPLGLRPWYLPCLTIPVLTERLYISLSPFSSASSILFRIRSTGILSTSRNHRILYLSVCLCVSVAVSLCLSVAVSVCLPVSPTSSNSLLYLHLRRLLKLRFYIL